jgi:hypothetical protein
MAERETSFGWTENAHHGCGCSVIRHWRHWCCEVSLGRSENPIRLVRFIGHHSAKPPIVSSSNCQLGLLSEMKKAASNTYNHEFYDGGRGIRVQHNVEKLW